MKQYDEFSDEGDATRQIGRGVWTREEHKRFLEATKIYVNGPWKLVAEYIGTRTVRQTMTHAQKYRQKTARRIRGLRTKQAIMRMHCGHEVSEESMAQERLRNFLGQSRHAYLPPELCALYLSSPTATSMMFSNNDNSMSSHLMEQFNIKNKTMEGLLSIKVNTTSSFTSMFSDQSSKCGSSCSSSPSSSDYQLESLPHEFENMEIIEDLSSSPTLEECVSVLLDVLFQDSEL